MKLYTEEQVRYILDLAYRSGVHIAKISVNVDKKLIPIELPSDEEIVKKSKGEYYMAGAWITFIGIEEQSGFITGAKWIKEEILNKNK